MFNMSQECQAEAIEFTEAEGNVEGRKLPCARQVFKNHRAPPYAAAREVPRSRATGSGGPREDS